MALIVLCGSGDCGQGIREWFHHESDGDFEKKLRAAGVEQFVYPDPPVVPYTLAGGRLQGVWFDRQAMSYQAPEDSEGIKRSVEQVDKEIDKLVAAGISPSRIGIVGNSMGGCLALHVGYGSGRMLPLRRGSRHPELRPRHLFTWATAMTRHSRAGVLWGPKNK
eukprot:gnl/TRDRNA2_/TRDRNA2_164675_c0_seq1.p1 gnl/TRDRNA2_/TRDRNA2_164675_c0~~gnl/TRDRNA2_/TRDRNA2_164675_c0_seq1.p1  ORF type:complete len:189 (-),score=22.75 gnl/TRDRNA2_/TRDRNA2_164675_c0_seq1:10-501(-)